MNSAAHSYYPLWDMTQPELPPRSRLCHLAPIGVRTPDVENLTSFTMRLAAAHCVETGVLFTREISSRLNYPPRLKSESEPLAYAFYQLHGIQTVNGIGPVVAHWISALESLTSQSKLHLLTMLPWKNLLTYHQSLLRKTRAWCPDCYADSKDQRAPIYEKLLWTLIPVSACVQHQRLLEENCPFCGCTSPMLLSRSHPGHCFRCDRWLGSDVRAKPSESVQTREALIQQIEKARIVGEMLTLSADLSPSFSPHDVNALLDHYTRQITMGNFAAFARFLDLNYQKLVALRSDVGIRLTLDTFIRLIQRLKLSVKDFLAGKEAEVELPDRREFHFTGSASSIKEMLQVAVNDPARPSLSELATQIGYKCKGSLKRIAPELCREISARNQEARVNNPQANKRRYDDKTLKEKFTAALAENPSATVRQIANALGYKDYKSLIDRCPNLYAALVERRRANRKQRNELLEKILKAALMEHPPPTIKAIAKRLDLKTTSAINHNFPELERAIADRARAYWEAGLKRAQLALESALTEVPPPSVPEVGRNTNHGVGKLYLNFPDLCHQVAANYFAYRHQRSIARKEEKRKFKMKRLN
jgi:TniQ